MMSLALLLDLFTESPLFLGAIKFGMDLFV